MKKYIVTKYDVYLDLWQFNENRNDHINILSFIVNLKEYATEHLWLKPYSEWVSTWGIEIGILGEYDTLEEALVNHLEFWI